jgi:hypothetical protein
VQSAWWAELMLCRTVTYDHDDSNPLHASTWWCLPEDLAVEIFSLFDRASLATLHLVRVCVCVWRICVAA